VGSLRALSSVAPCLRGGPPSQSVEEVARIRLLIRNGFTAEEIRLVVTPGAPHAERADRREVCAVVIDLYRRKLAELDDRIAVLREVRDRTRAVTPWPAARNASATALPT
jgi:DNA-binding transcriptional MerR regulator